MYLSNVGSKGQLSKEQQLQKQGKLPVAFNSDRRLISDFAKFNKQQQLEVARQRQS